MKTNVLTLAITLTIGVILAGSLLMPVLSDATTTERTFVNNGAFYVEANPTDIYTLEYSRSTESGVLYVNDEPIALSSSSYSVLVLDQSILRMEGFNNTMEYRGDGNSIGGIGELNITISGGSVTGTYQRFDGSTSFTWPTTTYTDAYVISADSQALIMSDYNTPVKMNEDSEILGFGLTRASAGGTALFMSKIEGNIADGVTVDILGTSTGTTLEGATVSNLEVNATKLDAYKDLYELTSITYTVTLADTTSYNVTYSAYIVPSEVSSELTNHLNPGEIAILNALPILIIVALVVMAAGALYLKRDD